MTEIIANHRNADTRLQKCDRTAVAHNMWADPAFSQRRNVLRRDSDILAQQVGSTISRERRATGAAKEGAISRLRPHDPL